MTRQIIYSTQILMPMFPLVSENQFQAIFEQSPFGILVFGPDGDCLGANRAWSVIWEAPLEQLVGYNILKDPHVGSDIDSLRAIRKAFEGEHQELPLTYYDPATIGRAGRPRYIQGCVYPIKNESQQVSQVVISFNDVTGQENAKRELSASRDFLEVINRVAPTIIAVYDVTTGEYLHLSEAFEKLLGYPTEQARRAGLPFMLSLVHPDDMARLMAQQAEALSAISAQKPGGQTNPIIPFEYRMKAADGSWKYLRTLGSVFQRDEAGGVKTVINASLDITELKEAIRFRDEFLAIASHELKTPLTPLKLQVGVLNSILARGQVNAISTEVLRKMTHVAERQIDRLTALVNNLLDVSRITLGRLVLNSEEGDLGNFVSEVVEGYKSQAAGSNFKLNINAPSGICLTFDSLRIAQVVTNLVNNAIVHAATNVIDVRVEANPEFTRARIIVRDEGKGIGAADLERIFDRSAVAQTVTGLGLGLFIVRQIARAHGGDIAVESQFGKGTTFTVELPLGKGSP